MATILVNAGGNLQAAINSAVGGDTLQLEDGATFTGAFTWPIHGSNSTVQMRGTTLPAPATRVSPGSAANFPKIQPPPGGEPGLRTLPGAFNWMATGIEFKPTPGGINDIIDLGTADNSQNTLASVPFNLTLDRCYIHGDATAGQKRAIGLNCSQSTVQYCYVSGIFATGQDSQAIFICNTPGGLLIDNNYLEAATENLLIGGDSIKLPSPTLPTGITITNNAFAKLPGWRGLGYNVKNLLELKTGVQVLIDSNTFDYNWGGEGQSGYAIVFTVRNEYGTTGINNPWATIAHVAFTRNKVRHSGAVFNILGQDDRGSQYPSVLMTDLVIRDTECWDIDIAWGGAGHLAQVQAGDRVTLDHNTGILTQGSQSVSVYLLGSHNLTNFTLTNNIFPNNSPNGPASICINGDQGQASGIPSLDAATSGGYTVARNTIYGPTPSNYPPDALYPAAIGNVGFTNVGANDYRLTNASPSHNAGLDGTDVGARFASAPVGTLPGAPITPVPGTAAMSVPITQVLGWTTGGNTLTYNVAFGTSNPPPTVSSGQAGTTYTPGTLAYSTTYFWQVTAVNADGSTASALWTFTTVAQPPSPSLPSNPSPASGATSVSRTPVLSWAASTGAASYGVRFGTSNPPPVVVASQVGLTYTPGTLAFGTTYYWQVSATNPTGTTLGPVWSFTTLLPALPTTPATPTPANAATGIAITTAVSWAASTGADTYSVKFGTTNPPLLAVASQVGTSYDPPGSLAFSTTYYWQISATNLGGTVTGPVWSFTTVAAPHVPTPPAVPTTPVPTDGSTGRPISQALSWGGAAGATTYSVAFGTASTPPLVVGGLATPTYTPGTLAYGTRYYWQVTATNADGSTLGPIWSFTTLAAPVPSAPSSPSPSNAATTVSITPTLGWSAAAATSYTVGFGLVSPPPTVSVGQASATYAPPAPLQFSTTYFWQVTAINAAGQTVGAIWSFTTSAAPSTPPATAIDGGIWTGAQSFLVKKQTTAKYTATLRDDHHVAIPAHLLTALTLTLSVIKADGTTGIVNGRNAQNVLNANNVTIDELGHLIWRIQPGDTTFVEAIPIETHLALFTWTWATGTGRHQVLLYVHDLLQVN